MTGDKIAAVLGAVSGLVVAGWFLVAAPMMENYERNGCVFLVCEVGK